MNYHNHRESRIENRASRIDNPVIYVPIRHYICREPSTNQLLFMQNKPNFQDTQMNLKFCKQMAYEYKHNWTLGQNKPNSNPIKPNFRKAKMNVNSLITKDYRKKDDFTVRKNKAKTNPISVKPKMNANAFSQKDYENETPRSTRKNKPNSNPIQTQTNPIKACPERSEFTLSVIEGNGPISESYPKAAGSIFYSSKVQG